MPVPDEPRTEAGRQLRGKMCWAFHAFSATEHSPDCEVARAGIVAVEREAAVLPEPPRFDSLKDAVAEWFVSLCPADWTEDEHVANAAINTKTEYEADLARTYVESLARVTSEPTDP